MGDCKDRCSKIVPIGRSPLYSTGAIVIADFKRTTKYETPSYDTLEALAKSATTWNWNASSQRQMLVLSNAVGLPFLPRGEEL
jgi:hypothetical protein